MFWKGPTFREFTKTQLEKYVTLSDCQLMDMYGKKYCRWDNYSMVAKKLESFRKRLWSFNKWKTPMLSIVRRIRHPIPLTWGRFNSQEIFYTLRTPLEIVEQRGKLVTKKLI